MLTLLTESFLNVNRDPKKLREPFELSRPWPDVELVTAEERAELHERLEARSAFA